MVSEEQIEAGAAVLAKGRLLDNKYAQRAIVEKIYLAMSQASPIEDGLVERVADAIEKPFLPHGYELKRHLLKSAARKAIDIARSALGASGQRQSPPYRSRGDD